MQYVKKPVPNKWDFDFDDLGTYIYIPKRWMEYFTPKALKGEDREEVCNQKDSIFLFPLYEGEKEPNQKTKKTSHRNSKVGI